MIKLLALACVLGQALAAPGMGMGMNPWAAQWMGGMGADPANPMSPWGGPWGGPWMNPGFPPQMPLSPGPGASPASPANLPAPFNPIMFGKGGMAIGAVHKQLGMSQAVISNKIKAAQDELTLHCGTLKSTAKLVPKDPCGMAGESAATDIENQITTAFTPCEMKTEMMQLRAQNIQFKQQMNAFKLSKKACKDAVDKATCMTEQTSLAGGELPASTAPTSLADINTKSDDCIANTKEGLMGQIENAHDDMLVC